LCNAEEKGWKKSAQKPREDNRPKGFFWGLFIGFFDQWKKAKACKKNTYGSYLIWAHCFKPLRYQNKGTSPDQAKRDEQQPLHWLSIEQQMSEFNAEAV
jgi:hypothetical protein